MKSAHQLHSFSWIWMRDQVLASFCTYLKCMICLSGFIFFVVGVYADPVIVMDVRGTKLKPGATIDGDKPLILGEGERITLIRTDGVTVTLRGPFDGVPISKKSLTNDPKQALSALVATRDARTNSVGSIRAAGDAKELPSPWLIDVTRPGVRCLPEGDRPIFWRPDATNEVQLTVTPLDRSYKVESVWRSKSAAVFFPELTLPGENNYFKVNYDQQEFSIQVIQIPKTIPQDLVLSAWLLEKGCVQQADALIVQLREKYEIK